MDINQDYDLVVIGGGAAGLMAAGQAAGLSVKTLLLEKMDQPGRKIFITGKFRCNLTNEAEIPEFIGHFGKEGRFLRQAFHRFFSDDLKQFFLDQGIKTITERGGRVFPASGRSQGIVRALVRLCETSGVTIQTYAPVDRVLIEDGQIRGVITPKTRYEVGKVILATGGASYPGTGSTGDGYSLAKGLGHKIIPIRPALVPLTTRGDTAQRLQGLSLRNVGVSVWSDGRKTTQGFGEMLFTHFGISGPAILTLSKQVVDALESKMKVQISIDLKPGLNEAKLDARLVRDLNKNGKKQFQTSLKDLLPSKMIPVCIDLVNIPGDRHRGFRHAIVTAGGVDTREIDPRTMESRLVKGLYFAGEVIDVDADTGGYNLQAAFSTGWLAGQSAGQTGDKHG